jgi:Intracellular proteinase inhibitor
MKRGILTLALLTPALALAQTLPGAKATPRPSSQEAAAAFAVKPPDEGSPFFTEREAAKDFVNDQGQNNGTVDTVAVYPRAKNSPDTATAMFTHFFTDMFASVHIGSLHTAPTTDNLKITPEDFSLKDRHELDTAYTVRNNSGKMMRLEFSTSQRVELLTEDVNGKVVNKWSDERGFVPEEGLVIINPKERIEYNESIVTREMKPKETYTIKADVVGYPDYTVTHSVTPSP